MPLGDGYYLNRRTHRLIRIWEHAQDAVARPHTFRSQAVAHLDPVRDREAIVTHVARQGFIRVRHWKERLGWQFWGDPDAAMADLRRYCLRQEVGPGAVVTVSDFASRQTIVITGEVARRRATATDLGLTKPATKRSQRTSVKRNPLRHITSGEPNRHRKEVCP